MKVSLSSYDNSWFDPGKGLFLKTCWFYINAVFFNSSIFPVSYLKTWLLEFFQARIGSKVVIKPQVNIKYPWNITIGDHTWIGEGVWLDSLAQINIGSNVCISQGAYLCTGNHDWSDPAFGLIVKPIHIEDGAWIGAKAVILPGVTIGTHSVVCAGAVVTRDTEPYMIYAGNPAVKIKERVIR
jgi:putative colanic acid biosynthesis acetyltransferase WcaF